MTQRTDRIDELLRQEIGDLIAREIADPAVGFVTVTDVETSPDLRHARVWVSVIGPADARAASVAALQRAMPFVRAQLGRRLRLKRIPEFSVRLDESVSRGARVLQLLSELEAGVEPAGGPPGESLPTPRPLHPREGDEELQSDDAVGADTAGETAPARRPSGRVRGSHRGEAGSRSPDGRGAGEGRRPGSPGSRRPGSPGQRRGAGGGR